MDSTKQSEDEIERLRKQIVSLQERKTNIADKRTLLQAELSGLKESDAIRAKALQEDCDAVNKSKSELIEKCEHINAESTSCASKLRDYQERLKRDFEDRGAKMDVVEADELSEVQNSKTDVAELVAQVAELKAKVDEKEEKAREAEEEKTKAEENVTETLAEFKTLDTFARSLQASYAEIQLWYEAFEAWNSTSSCEDCKHPINVGAIVAEEIERKNKSNGVSPNIAIELPA